VIGDVHTHPGSGVTQSATDRGSPMVALTGHISVIIPDLAGHSVTPGEAGIHTYLGEDGWSSWTGADAARRLKVRRFR
jgi:proteasome lid subunit RPN8/RPN11